MHRFASSFLTLGFCLLPAAGAAQATALTAPERAVVGSSISVTWTGPNAAGDFISIDPADAPSSQYGTYVYANVAQPATLVVPDVPGAYNLRYHTGASEYPVLATRSIVVTDVRAEFDALAPVAAGAEVVIAWRGPAYAGDFISIDQPGSDDQAYGPYDYTTSTPVTIRAPDAAGSYTVRYHLAGSYRVIGETALVVGSVSATLTASSEGSAGSAITVTWTGPDAALDYVSIDPDGAPPDEYGTYAYTSAGSSLELRLPDEPGRYALRYHMGQSGAVIATAPIVVLPNTATLEGPTTVVGSTEFDVTWAGPDNPGDYVTIVRAGADPRDYFDYAYTSVGTTLRLGSPLDAGPHELRYMTGRSRQILASRPITVTPGAAPGRLRVVGGADVPGPDRGAVELILDASGSMLQRIGGTRRIELARTALDRLVAEVIPPRTRFAFRAFGHREAGSCRTDLEIPAAPLDPANARASIGQVQALNLSRTPIGASLELVRQDLAGVQGPVVVVLVTDGEETCDGDPAAAIEALRSSGLDVRVNIVGFAIDEQQLRETFQAWSRLGNGRYVEANDGAQLAAAMGGALGLPFEVLVGDEVVATGIADGPEVRLAPGTYQIRLLGSAPRDLGSVTVTPDGDHSVSAGPSGGA